MGNGNTFRHRSNEGPTRHRLASRPSLRASPIPRMLARGEFGIRNSEFGISTHPSFQRKDAKTQRGRAHPPNQGRYRGTISGRESHRRQRRRQWSAAGTPWKLRAARADLAPRTLRLCLFALNRVGGWIQHPASRIEHRVCGRVEWGESGTTHRWAVPPSRWLLAFRFTARSAPGAFLVGAIVFSIPGRRRRARFLRRAPRGACGPSGAGFFRSAANLIGTPSRRGAIRTMIAPRRA